MNAGVTAIAAGVLVIACLGTAGAARADDTVAVVFEFKEPAIADHFNPNRAAAERQVGKALADRLTAVLKFWTFAPATTYPQLRIFLKKGAADWQIVTGFYADPTTLVRTWTTIWRTDGDLLRTGGFGPPPHIVRSLQDAFDDPFLLAQRDEVIDTMKKLVPLGRRAPIVSGSGAVLPLDWDRYEILKVSQFYIRYRTPAGVAVVPCSGVGTWSAYAAPPPSRGLAVTLGAEYEVAGTRRRTRAHLADIRAMEPIGVYLERYDNLGAFLTGPAGSAKPALAAPER